MVIINIDDFDYIFSQTFLLPLLFPFLLKEFIFPPPRFSRALWISIITFDWIIQSNKKKQFRFLIGSTCIALICKSTFSTINVRPNNVPNLSKHYFDIFILISFAVSNALDNIHANIYWEGYFAMNSLARHEINLDFGQWWIALPASSVVQDLVGFLNFCFSLNFSLVLPPLGNFCILFHVFCICICILFSFSYLSGVLVWSIHLIICSLSLFFFFFY